MAASTARRAVSRIPAPKTASSNDDDPPEEPKAKRATSKPVAPGAKPAVKAKPPATRPRARPSALVQRVYNTIDGELTKLEKQKGLTSQDRERASRALSQMVNALEKAVEMLDGRAYRLVLTLGALAELESAFGDDDMLALAARFEKGRLSARDCVKIIAAGLRGAGCAVTDEEVALMRAESGAAGYVDIVARLLNATFGGNDPQAPHGRNEEGDGETPAPFAGRA